MGRTIDVDVAVKEIMNWTVKHRDPFITGIALGIAILLNDERAIPTVNVEKKDGE